MDSSRVPPTEYEVVEQFTAAMREHGIDVDENIIADGKLHRYHVAGDRGRARNAWAVLHVDEHPAGKFGCNKRFTGEKFTWTMKGTHPLTAEQREELRETARLRAAERRAEVELRHAQAQERALDIYNAGAPVTTHPYLAAKGVPSSPRLRVGPWTYVDEETGEVIVLAERALLVPMMDATLTIHSIQAIFEDGDGGFEKKYLKDGAKEGKFLSMGKPRDGIVLVCEGLSTGLSLWQCTGHAVIVAFDAGNLLSVAREVRRVLGVDARIVVCADNDAWTTGRLPNPGLHYARLAAIAVGGLVAYPEFRNVETKPTDFNDLHQIEGEEPVRQAIARALEPPVEQIVDARADHDEPPKDAGPPADPPEETEDDDDRPEINPYFTILGYDQDSYYFFQKEKRQVLTLTWSQIHEGSFTHLASVNWWEEMFRGEKGGINKRAAVEFIMRTANRRGLYNPNRVRGRGAWVDAGRRVYHHGQYLTVDGQIFDTTRIKSKYIYALGKELEPPADVPATDDEGYALLQLASAFRWTMKGSAPLLMGWIFLAPLCGALRWRPHIWLTGNAGGGKSTILAEFIIPLLADKMLAVQGNSTEPGIRQKLLADSIPVVIDEFEQNEERDVQRVQAVLSLARQASTESQAQTYKGTSYGSAQHFFVRSMFCFASIQVGIKHQSDIERVSVLALKPKMLGKDSAAQWEALSERLHTLVASDPGISGRLFRRGLDMLPTILKNVEVFKSVAARVFNSQRAGDQYGTLLAGCFSLLFNRVVEPRDAEFFINSYDWNEHVDESDNDEGKRALSALLEAHIRGPRGVDLTVHEVLSAAKGVYMQGVELDPAVAAAMLARYGMKIDGKYLMLSNQSNELRSLLADTTFKADWRGVLLRLPGSDRNNNKAVRLNGALVKVTRIDLTDVIDANAVISAEPERGEFVAPF